MPMVFRIIALLLPFLWVPQAFTKDSLPKCLMIFQKLQDQVADLPKIKSSQVDDIFLRYAEEPHIAAKALFELYFKGRLEVLMPEDRQKIKTLLADHTKSMGVWEALFKFGGRGSHYNSRKQAIFLVQPTRYQMTLMGYYELAHELEHAIQDIKLQRGMDMDRQEVSKSLANLSLRDIAKVRFEQERGAMIAEWQFIRSIPRQYRNQLLAQISRDKMLPPWFKKLYVRSLESAEKSLEEYLDIQYKAGRYSFEDLNKDLKSERNHLKARDFFLIFGIPAIAYYCNSSIKKNIDSNFTEWCLNISKGFRTQNP